MQSIPAFQKKRFLLALSMNASYELFCEHKLTFALYVTTKILSNSSTVNATFLYVCNGVWLIKLYIWHMMLLRILHYLKKLQKLCPVFLSSVVLYLTIDTALIRSPWRVVPFLITHFEESICRKCNSNEVDDEIHFLPCCRFIGISDITYGALSW